MWSLQQKDELRHRMKLHLETHDLLKPNTRIAYGTAGFRGPAKQIGWIFYRAGIMVALRCFDVKQAVGIMITASHNPINDNGIKFIDDDGQMLASTWELIVDEVCNMQEIDTFIEAIDNVVKKHKINCNARPKRAQIFIGYDTRPSSQYLASVVIDGIEAVAGSLIPITDFGLCTTPELHWLVGEANLRCPDTEPAIQKQAYLEQLVAGLLMNFKCVTRAKEEKQNTLYDRRSLVVDCANGVGREIMLKLQKSLEDILPIELTNVDTGVLNESCGADYIKTQLSPAENSYQPGKRYASLDGDADRLVYYYMLEGESNQNVFRLLDGDKIQALYALYMGHIINSSRYKDMLSMACIQTAYANGACTDFLKASNFRVDCVDTGVKNLHKQAIKYDISIYFEANGHGTIYLSERARNLFTSCMNDLESPHDPKRKPTDEEKEANRIFANLCALLNHYTGDGIADILLVEHILRYFDWDIGRWYSLYRDRPNRLMKLAISDKELVKTQDAGRKCHSPLGLQAEIDSIVAGFGPKARCFVRASGTENVVRIYAEADTQEAADEIANMVGKKTKQFCDE